LATGPTLVSAHVMRRLLAAVALAALLSSGCTFAARRHRGLGIAADATLVAAALVWHQTDKLDESSDGPAEAAFNIIPVLIGYGIVLGLGAAGIALGVAALTSEAITASQAPETPPQLAVDATTQRVGAAALHAAERGQCEDAAVLLAAVERRHAGHRAEVADAIERDGTCTTAGRIPASGDELDRLADQVRDDAAAGDCARIKPALGALHARDAELYAALSIEPQVAACLAVDASEQRP
jgi:hypothetical protein